MKTLILDNFDSFTYNLYQYCAELGGDPHVFRNNEIDVVTILRERFTHIIISPGPGAPNVQKDFGMCGEVILKLMRELPILGVCLGHQGIVHFMGGRVIRALEPVHGKRSVVRVKGIGPRVAGCETPNIFEGLPREFEVMRYHSLIAERASMPEDLVITAETVKDDLVMGLQHRKFPLYGVQFHPESIGTPHGKKILKNFLRI